MSLTARIGMNRADSDASSVGVAEIVGNLPGYPICDLGTHVPARNGLLARLYVARGKVAQRAFFATLAACAVAGAAWTAWTYLEPNDRKHGLSAGAEVLTPAEARDPATPKAAAKKGRVTARQVAEGKDTPDAAELEKAFKAVEDRIAFLETFLARQREKDSAASLRIRIADGEGQPSAFWRRSEDGDLQHFAIVEAVTEDGSPYAWEVEDMDDGSVSRRERWAIRITGEEYARIASEKSAGRTLADALAGTKAPGGTEISWRIGTAGGALADWKEKSE